MAEETSKTKDNETLDGFKDVYYGIQEAAEKMYWLRQKLLGEAD
jgi:hypothetical protein